MRLNLETVTTQIDKPEQVFRPHLVDVLNPPSVAEFSQISQKLPVEISFLITKTNKQFYVIGTKNDGGFGSAGLEGLQFNEVRLFLHTHCRQENGRRITKAPSRFDYKLCAHATAVGLEMVFILIADDQIIKFFWDKKTEDDPSEALLKFGLTRGYDMLTYHAEDAELISQIYEEFAQIYQGVYTQFLSAEELDNLLTANQSTS